MRSAGYGDNLARALRDAGRRHSVPRSWGFRSVSSRTASGAEILADVGLTAQDVARRIAEWTAKLAERADGVVSDPEKNTAVERP